MNKNISVFARYIYKNALEPHFYIIILSSIFGIASRLLSLAGFAATLYAIIAAISVSYVQRHFERLAAYIGDDFSFDETQIVVIIISFILVCYLANYALQYFKSRLLGIILQKVCSLEPSRNASVPLDYDSFVIENLSSTIRDVERAIETSVFIFIVLVFIAIIMPELALIMLPVLGVMVVINVMGNRANVHRIKQQNDARKSYINEKGADGKLRRRKSIGDCEERSTYLSVREDRRHKTSMKPYLDQIVGALAICCIIYYIHTLDIDPENIAGIIIIFVISIRNVVAAGHELSGSISNIFDLRRHMDIISSDKKLH